MANKYIALLLVCLVIVVAVEAKENDAAIIAKCNRHCFAGCPSVAYVCKKWCSLACKMSPYINDAYGDAAVKAREGKYPVPTKEDILRFQKGQGVPSRGAGSGAGI